MNTSIQVSGPMADLITPIAAHMKTAFHFVAEEGKVVTNWLGKQVEVIRTHSEKWVAEKWGQTALQVYQKVFDVLPEITAMLGLFSGFAVLPVVLLAGRAVYCFSDVCGHLSKGDLPAARQSASPALQEMLSKFVQGAVVTSFATAAFFGATGILTASLSRLAKAGIFFSLGFLGRHLVLPPDAHLNIPTSTTTTSA